MQDGQARKFFEKHGLTPPTSEAHGTEDDIARNLTPQKVQRWWLEGNQLKGETSSGVFGQTIPSNYICKGIDDKGKPILKKIVLS